MPVKIWKKRTAGLISVMYADGKSMPAEQASGQTLYLRCGLEAPNTLFACLFRAALTQIEIDRLRS